MNNALRIITTSLLIGLPWPAESVLSGNDLYNTGSHRGDYFDFFVYGVYDGTLVSLAAVEAPAPFPCKPHGVTMGQISEIAWAYIKKHPEKRHKPASALVIESILEAFPCGKNK